MIDYGFKSYMHKTVLFVYLQYFHHKKKLLINEFRLKLIRAFNLNLMKLVMYITLITKNFSMIGVSRSSTYAPFNGIMRSCLTSKSTNRDLTRR